MRNPHVPQHTLRFLRGGSGATYPSHSLWFTEVLLSINLPQLDTPVRMPLDRPAGGQRLRLLCYNIQAGANTRRYRDYVTRGWQHVLPLGKQDQLDRLATHLTQFDLVGLQEADAGSLRSGFVNQAQYLAERAGFPYWSQQENRRVGPIASSSNSMLSRIIPAEVHDYRLPGRVKGRGALLALFGPEHERLAVVIAHLSLGQNARATQFSFLRELIWQYKHIVLMGDFNCAGEHPRFLRFLLETGLRQPGCPPTFPSWQPQRAIDHVLLSPSIQCLSYQALPVTLSDHLPLAVELDLPVELAMHKDHVGSLVMTARDQRTPPHP